MSDALDPQEDAGQELTAAEPVADLDSTNESTRSPGAFAALIDQGMVSPVTPEVVMPEAEMPEVVVLSQLEQYVPVVLEPEVVVLADLESDVLEPEVVALADLEPVEASAVEVELDLVADVSEPEVVVLADLESVEGSTGVSQGAFAGLVPRVSEPEAEVLADLEPVEASAVEVELDLVADVSGPEVVVLADLESVEPEVAQPQGVADADLAPDASEPEVVVLADLEPVEPEVVVLADLESVEASATAPRGAVLADLVPDVAEAEVVVLSDLERSGESPRLTIVADTPDRSHPVFATAAADRLAAPASYGLRPDLVIVPELDDDVIELEPVAQGATAPTSSVFARLASEPVESLNPYASLAPDDNVAEATPAQRNPYAELAPNFADDDFRPSPDVEPGDWESMLEDWPIADTKTTPKRPSRAFSRYT